MKRRLHQTALTEVEGILARQQSIAQQTLRPLETAALREVAVVRDEDVADVLRIVDEENLLAAHPVRHEVPVLARESGEKRERIAAGTVDQRSEQRDLRSRRRRGRGHCPNRSTRSG